MLFPAPLLPCKSFPWEIKSVNVFSIFREEKKRKGHLLFMPIKEFHSMKHPPAGLNHWWTGLEKTEEEAGKKQLPGNYRPLLGFYRNKSVQMWALCLGASVSLAFVQSSPRVLWLRWIQGNKTIVWPLLLHWLCWLLQGNLLNKSLVSKFWLQGPLRSKPT